MIYVTGDSFCWGDEIADYIVPEWPGYNGQSSPENQNIWNRSRTIFLHQHKEEHDEIRLKNRWSTLLGNHLGMNVINSSFSGKSIHNMLTCMMHDLPKLNNVQYVIVQLTGLYRFQVPCVTEIENIQFQKGYAQINPLADTNHVDEIKQISKLRISLNKDIDFLYDYLSTIYLMQLLVKQFTKNNLIILDSIFLTEYGNILKIIEEEKDDPNIANLLKLTNFVNEVNKFPTMNDIYINNKNICNMTPSRHFCINTHKIFAEQIAKKILV